MGAGAVSAAVQGASDNSLRELMAGLNPIVRERIQIALCVLSDPVELNIYCCMRISQCLEKDKPG